MSTLLAKPLVTELSQEIRFNLNTRVQVGAIIPYILMFGKPDGVFTLSLLRGVDTIFTQDFTCEDIQEALDTTDENAHVFYPFIPDDLLQVEKDLYELKISASGYVFHSNSYLGWLQQFEDVQNEMDYIPTYVEENSLAYRIKEYREGIN